MYNAALSLKTHDYKLTQPVSLSAFELFKKPRMKQRCRAVSFLGGQESQNLQNEQKNLGVESSLTSSSTVLKLLKRLWQRPQKK
jgi:hypothetical protein